jgi:Txe/YoeB family toxin of Txe-Axe toxin-antitoxin module
MNPVFIMRKNKLLLFILMAIFSGCKQEEDLTPSYLGTYTTNFTTTERSFGAVRSEKHSTGKLVVTMGSVSKTVRIDNLTDISGKVIDFEVKSGKYYYNGKYTSQGCNYQYTFEGKFEGNTINFSHIFSRDCNNDYRVTTTEGQGHK